MAINRRMDKQIVVYSYKGILHSSKNELIENMMNLKQNIDQK